MIDVAVRSWAAWSPGLDDEAAWRAWAASPAALPAEGAPDVSFLPALLRRRCMPLARALLRVAFAACPEDRRAHVRTVFGSRHGENRECFPLSEDVSAGRPLSPNKFTHTVHNAAAGLFSIATGNREASSSVAAEADTFVASFVEALAQLDRAPASETLLVVGDVPVADAYLDLVGHPPSSFALALRLARAEAGERVRLLLAPAAACSAGGTDTARDGTSPASPLATRPWPDAAEWLRWWLGDAPFLALGHGPCGYRFERVRS